MAAFRGYAITQNFGVPNSSYRLGYHPGTDFARSLGQPQMAFAPGIARFHYAAPTAIARQRGSGYGNTGTITLDNGDVVYYAHLKDNGILVPNGSRVNDFQDVFVTGDTGWVEGIHAHIEYRLGGSQDRPVDITKKVVEKGEDVNATKEQLQLIYEMAFPMEPINWDWIGRWSGKDMNLALQNIYYDKSRQDFGGRLVEALRSEDTNAEQKLAEIKKIIGV